MSDPATGTTKQIIPGAGIGTKRIIDSQLGTGIAAVITCTLLAIILWPIWSMFWKGIFASLAAQGLATVDAATQAKLLQVMVEGSFFWMVINPWIWQTLIMGNYGKDKFGAKQPVAGIWYVLVAWVSGILVYFALIGFLGIWWKPFSLGLMLMPQTAAEVALAIEGWEAANFFALAVILAQIPFASLLHKWPFAGTSKQPIEGLSVLFFSSLVTFIVWMALIVPSFLHPVIDGHHITNPPFGSWPSFVAFCQAFVFFAIMPAEGAEGYPMKFFAKKQPYMAIAGFLIALAAGLTIPNLLRPIVEPLNLLPGAPVDAAIASLELSVIVFMLVWHHLFEDYPSAAMVPGTAARVCTRIAIWLVGGIICGVVWLKIFMFLPYGANNMGLGYPTMGFLAGQFAFLMAALMYNTFMDKWPWVQKN